MVISCVRVLRGPMVWALVLGAPVWGADWANFRGPNHDGISQSSGFKKDWAQSPPVLWEAVVGPAFSSFACVGQRVYTCGTEAEHQVLFCLDGNNGKVIWKLPFEAQYMERQGGDGTRATPSVSDGRVYVLGARGRLICASADEGKILWETQYNQPPQWGYSGSVLIEGDMALACGGGPDGDLAAYDKASGKLLWKSGEDLVGYSTPYPFTFQGVRYLAAFTGKAATVVKAQTGKSVWRMPWKTDWNVNAAAPIFSEDHLFFSSGYKHGAILLKLTPEGEGFKAGEVWQNTSVRNKFQSSILYQGHLYTSDETGLKCVEFLTGSEKWSKRGINNGTLVIADGCMIILTEDGDLMFAPATPTGFNPTPEVKLFEKRCWTVPVMHDGRLLVRDTERVVCLNLKDP